MLRKQPFVETHINHRKAHDSHFNAICIKCNSGQASAIPLQSISGKFRYKTQLEKIKKKEEILTKCSCLGLSGSCVLLQQSDNQQYFTLDCIKNTHIHHPQVPNTEIVAMENVHLNIYFTKQYKLTTEDAVPVWKQSI